PYSDRPSEFAPLPATPPTRVLPARKSPFGALTAHLHPLGENGPTTLGSQRFRSLLDPSGGVARSHSSSTFAVFRSCASRPARSRSYLPFSRSLCSLPCICSNFILGRRHMGDQSKQAVGI